MDVKCEGGIKLIKKILVMGVIILFLCLNINQSSGTIIKKTSSTNIGYSGYIQDLIDNASDGDTIYIPSGTYYENIFIDKSISLIGEDKNNTIIDGSREFSVVGIVNIDEVNISGFTIRNGEYGITTRSVKNITISGNNIVSNNGIGVNLISSNFNTIKGNIITLNNYTGISIMADPFGPEPCDYNIVKNNNITSNNGYGIIFSKSNFNIIIENNFINNEKDAFIIVSFQNRWKQNYWDRSRILPKLIFGFNLFGIPWFNIDWRPAKKPYNI